MAKTSSTGKKSTKSSKSSTASAPAKPARGPDATAADAPPPKVEAAGASESTAAAAPPEPQKVPALPSTEGKVSIFGGPKDRGLKPDDKLALPTGQHFVYERVRSLNPHGFYCSMRWEYHVEHMTPEEVKRWWANKKLQITNPRNKVSVVARAVDWGPHEKTGLDVGISPGAAEALGVEAGDDVEIALADPKSPLGVVS